MKTEDKLVVEVKKIGMRLRGTQIFQASSYAAFAGIPWVVLTNGLVWQLFHISTGEKIDPALVFTIDLKDWLDDEEAEYFYLISKLGISRKGLLDRILMGPREGRVHQVARVRMPRMNRQLSAVLDAMPYVVDIGKIEPGVHALRVEIQGEIDQCARIVRQIQGLNALQAQAVLAVVPRKGARLVAKTLRSALANAENNHRLKPETLRIKEAVAGTATSLKRFVAKARGSVARS